MILSKLSTPYLFRFVNSRKILLYPKRPFSFASALQQLARKASRDKIASKSQHVPRLSEIKSLMRLARPEKYKLIGGVALLTISSSVTMTIPFIMGRILDLVFKEPEIAPSTSTQEPVAQSSSNQRSDRVQAIKESMRKYMVGLVVFFIAGACATFGRVYLMNFAGERVVNRLRTTAFSSIIKQEIAFFDKAKTGELINRLSNDVWTVGYATTMNISDGLRATVGAIGGTAMMFYVSPTLGIVGLSIVPPVAAFAIVYGRYIRSITKQMNDALADATVIAEERLSNIRTVRAFCAESKEQLQYNRQIDSVLNIAKKESLAKGLFFGFNMLSGSMIMLALLYSGGSLIAAGSITIGDLSSFLLYALYVGVSMSGISSFYTELMHGIGASSRLFELTQRKPQIPLTGGEKPEEMTGTIEFRNLHFTYRTQSEIPVLKGVNLIVPARSTLAFVGSSGSGKSTLASLLLRLYDPTKGQVLIDDVDIKTLDPSWLRSHIGTVNQEPSLFSCTIRENIAYSASDINSVSLSSIEEAAKRAHAYDFIQKFPLGFDTLIGERGVTLSGGQKQRIAIARALLKDPKILIMDEATSALDAESEHAVKETLDSLMYGGDRTILIIAHRLSTIRNADKIAVLHEGKIVELGSYWQLMSITDGHFRKLVQRQMIAFEEDGNGEKSTSESSADDEDSSSEVTGERRLKE